MKATGTIFQASDMNQRGRAILDAAREGGALLRDKDGVALVVVPESLLSALRAVARIAANLCELEHTLSSPGDNPPQVFDYGEWTWLRVFDEEDLREYVREMREALAAAAREESSELVDETLLRWRTTAEALEDPLRRGVLLGSPGDDEFVEVDRPG